MPAKKTAQDVAEMDAIARIREAAFNPSLDEVWAKHPVLHPPEQRSSLVEGLRQERALWHTQGERRTRRKNERTGVSSPTPETPGDIWDE